MSPNSYLSAAAAFVLWGGWALYVNSNDSFSAGVQAGVTQGAASFVITLLMVRCVQYWAQRFEHPLKQLLLPAVLTVSATGSGLVLIHWLAKTPNIATTIAPALTVAFAFCVATSMKLQNNSSETPS